METGLKNKILNCILLILTSFIIFYSAFGFRKQVPLQLEDEFAVFSRPYSTSSIKSAFTGPWIPKGLKDNIRNYYRPFAIVAYACLYDLCGQDTAKLHHVRQLFSIIKIVAFFGVLYWLTNRSLLAAFSATILYSISFKIFDEQIVFQCLPDIIVTTIFYTILFLFILFSNRQFNRLQTIGIGVGISFLYITGIGTKENALFLIPTLLIYRLIYTYWGWQQSFSKMTRLFFERKQIFLFSALFAISLIYFVIRYYSLGTQYLISNSYRTGASPITVALLNIGNNFALIPITYMDRPIAINNLSAIMKCLLNLVLPSVAIYLLFFRNLDEELKKGILFSLVLILLNTFFYTQLVRVRFNSIGNLGCMYISVIIVKQLWIYVRGDNVKKYYYQVVFAAILACLCFYAIHNAVNIHSRQHPTQVLVSIQ